MRIAGSRRCVSVVAMRWRWPLSDDCGRAQQDARHPLLCLWRVAWSYFDRSVAFGFRGRVGHACGRGNFGVLDCGWGCGLRGSFICRRIAAPDCWLWINETEKLGEAFGASPGGHFVD